MTIDFLYWKEKKNDKYAYQYTMISLDFFLLSNFVHNILSIIVHLFFIYNIFFTLIFKLIFSLGISFGVWIKVCWKISVLVTWAYLQPKPLFSVWQIYRFRILRLWTKVYPVCLYKCTHRNQVRILLIFSPIFSFVIHK